MREASTAAACSEVNPPSRANHEASSGARGSDKHCRSRRPRRHTPGGGRGLQCHRRTATSRPRDRARRYSGRIARNYWGSTLRTPGADEAGPKDAVVADLLLHNEDGALRLGAAAEGDQSQINQVPDQSVSTAWVAAKSGVQMGAVRGLRLNSASRSWGDLSLCIEVIEDAGGDRGQRRPKKTRLH